MPSYTFYVSKDVLGTDKHLRVNESPTWTDTVPENAWLLSTKSDQTSCRCLNTALHLSGNPIDVSPPEKFVKIAHSCKFDQNVKWSEFMPKRSFDDWAKKLISNVGRKLHGNKLDYFRSVWVPSQRLFESLCSSYIDREIWNQYASNTTKPPAIESFQPDENDVAYVTSYDRLRTRTGRLVVDSGPNILVLKKTARNIIRSSYGDDGTIMCVDFSSLEPRVAMAEASDMKPPVDIYSFVSKKFLNNSYDRNIVKQVLISEMNGVSRSTLAKKLDMNGIALSELIATIRELFGLEKLAKKLREEWEVDQKITTKYNRRIPVEDDSDSMFINSFVQSTAVDVALLGFTNLLDKLPSTTRPLFSLHDALIIDVENKDITSLLGMKSLPIPGYEHEFPVKVSMFYQECAKQNNM